MKAPAPHEPEASAVIEGLLGRRGNRPVPFQTSMYVCHQTRSALHLWSNLVRWFAAFKRDMASIRLLIKGLPAGTTCAASHSRPMTTCRSCLDVDFLLHHSAKVHFKRVSLVCGRRSSMDTVSISIPRKVRVVAGPSTLAGSTGSPSLVAVWIARSRVRWQVARSADQKMKSSK